jgi:hypothetical protein
MFSPLEFEFSLEPGMSDSEIEFLWQKTQQAQSALDAFLAGQFTEAEMTDLLSDSGLDLDQTRETLEDNANYLGLIAL